MQQQAVSRATIGSQETGRARLLMCRPRYYGIEYEINPWMSKVRPADQEKAAGQWERLRGVLDRLSGVDVEVMEPAEGLPDLVFAANAGLVRRETFIRSNFRFKERAREEPVWERWFTTHGYDVRTLPVRCKFEGEGDLLFAGERGFAGWRFRSHRSSHAHVERITGVEVTSLKLVDPYFYHLDTCFAPLGPDRVMYYPPAFDAQSQAAIRRHFSHRIVVPPEEARRFVCNAVVLGETVVTSSGCPVTEAALSVWGYRTIAVDTSEFIKAGGSCKCMVLLLG